MPPPPHTHTVIQLWTSCCHGAGLSGRAISSSSFLSSLWTQCEVHSCFSAPLSPGNCTRGNVKNIFSRTMRTNHLLSKLQPAITITFVLKRKKTKRKPNCSRKSTFTKHIVQCLYKWTPQVSPWQRHEGFWTYSLCLRRWWAPGLGGTVRLQRTTEVWMQWRWEPGWLAGWGEASRASASFWQKTTPQQKHMACSRVTSHLKGHRVSSVRWSAFSKSIQWLGP